MNYYTIIAEKSDSKLLTVKSNDCKGLFTVFKFFREHLIFPTYTKVQKESTASPTLKAGRQSEVEKYRLANRNQRLRNSYPLHPGQILPPNRNSGYNRNPNRQIDFPSCLVLVDLVTKLNKNKNDTSEYSLDPLTSCKPWTPRN